MVLSSSRKLGQLGYVMVKEWAEINGVDVARQILKAVEAQGKLHPAVDVVTFGAAIKEMALEYELIRTAESMPSIGAVQKTFGELQTAAKRFRDAYNERIGRSWIEFFLLTSLNSSESDTNVEAVDQELQTLSEMTNRLIAHLDTGLAYCAEEARGGTLTRFLELADVTAVAWLYGHAIPNLYERFMGGVYTIDGREKDSTEQRFAKALLKSTGLPETSVDNLRSHAYRQQEARTAALAHAAGTATSAG